MAVEYQSGKANRRPGRRHAAERLAIGANAPHTKCSRRHKRSQAAIFSYPNCFEPATCNPYSFITVTDSDRSRLAVPPSPRKDTLDFSSFGLHARVASGVHRAGYDTPTPIQAQAIPPVLEGKDVLGLAQTGTGKTAAFALPILQQLLDGPRNCVRALVVAPTRELAQQIHEAFGSLGKETGIRSVPIFGGVGANQQIQALRGRAEIVVACPGRLLDHLRQGTADLSNVEVLVLDEADRMFDMGFLPDIRRIVTHLPKQRQNLLFSATMPRDIRRLANEILVDPVTIEVDLDRPASTISHAVYRVEERDKTEALLELLYDTDTESVLVFTRTKHRARRVAETLAKAGFRATCLQGNLSQTRRHAALEGFRRGTYQILVATDIAARGIDVSTISHVINYDMPDTVDAYTHRIGRTGRATRTGDAFTLTTRADEAAIRAIERMMGTRIEQRRLEGRSAQGRPIQTQQTPPSRPQTDSREAVSGTADSRPRHERQADSGRPAKRPHRKGQSRPGNGRTTDATGEAQREPGRGRPADSNGPGRQGSDGAPRRATEVNGNRRRDDRGRPSRVVESNGANGRNERGTPRRDGANGSDRRDGGDTPQSAPKRRGWERRPREAAAAGSRA